VFDHTAPTAAELVLNRLTPFDDRYDVGVQQPETSAIIESSIKVEGLDAQVKAIKKFEDSLRTSLEVSPACS